MKKIIFHSIIFCSIFVAGIIALSYIVRPEFDTKRRFAGFYAEPENTIDTVLIGGSPLHPAWAAPLAWKEEGIATYPLAVNSEVPQAIKFFLKDALKYQSPKVVVVETRMFKHTKKYFEDIPEYEAVIRNVTDSLKYSMNRVEAVNSLVEKPGERYLFYFDIIKYHSNWKKSLTRSAMAYYQYKKKDPLKGYLPIGTVEEQKLNYLNTKGILPIPPEQEKELKELIQYAQKEKIELLFLVNPYVATEDDMKMFHYMKKLVTENSKYNFLNIDEIYEQAGIDFSHDFYNAGHMNIYGAEKYTRFLAKYLKEHYNLEDKRTEKGCDSWEESYQTWSSTVEQLKSGQ